MVANFIPFDYQQGFALRSRSWHTLARELEFHATTVLLIFTSMLGPPIAPAQSLKRETVEDFLTRLSPEQKQQFDTQTHT
jgi:hypothetical protein